MKAVKYTIWTYPEMQRLREMAEDGLPAKVIAETLGRTRNSVYDRARKMDVRLQYPCGENTAKTRLPDEIVKAIRVMREGGISVADITRVLNRQFRISPTHAKGICRGERRQEAPA